MITDLYSLHGKRAVVTGGASGLGKGIAMALAGAGADVAVLDINEQGAQQVSRQISDLGKRSIAMRLDVTNYEQVKQVIEKVGLELAGIDIAVNAAGIASGLEQDKTADAIWRRVINVNLTGLYYCCLEEGEIMKTQKQGKIMNMASMSATVVNRFPEDIVDESRQIGLPAYCSAKAGVRQLTKTLAAFWAKYNIRVNCISPGYMATPLTEEIFQIPEIINAIRRDTPLGRVGVPADLAGIAVYLASDSSDFMTGSEIVIDGGYTLW